MVFLVKFMTKKILLIVVMGLGLFSAINFKFNNYGWFNTGVWIVAIIIFLLIFCVNKLSLNRKSVFLGVILWTSIFAVLSYKLSEFPGGIWTDEVETTLAGEGLIKEMIDRKIFIPFSPEATGHPALSLLINGFSSILIGKNTLALKFPAVVTACFSIVAFFFLLKEFFNENISTVGAFVFGFSYWFISFGRMGYDAAYFWLIEVLVILNLVKFWKWKEKKFLLLTCFWLGIGMYTYLAFRTLAIGIGIMSFFLVLRMKKNVGEKIKILFLAGFVFGLIVSPLFFYARRNPEIVFGRSNDVSVFNKKFNDINRIKMIKENSIKTMGMFFWRGDPNLRHNIAQRPVLNLFEGLLFIVGLVIVLIKRQYFLVGMVVILGGISAANGIFTYEPPFIIQPHSLRTLGLLPLVYLIITVTFVEIKKRTDWKWIIVLVLICGIINLKNYFGTKITKEIYDAFQTDQTRTALLVAKNCQSAAIISRSLISKPHLNFLAPGCNYQTFNGEQKTGLLILNESDYQLAVEKEKAINISYLSR
jgi:hypothetical protein